MRMTGSVDADAEIDDTPQIDAYYSQQHFWNDTPHIVSDIVATRNAVAAADAAVVAADVVVVVVVVAVCDRPLAAAIFADAADTDAEAAALAFVSVV